MENDGICLQIIWCPRYGIEGHHRVVIHGGEIDVVRCTLLLCSLNLRRRRLPEFHTERMGSKAAAPSATRLTAPVNGATQLYQKAGRLGFVSQDATRPAGKSWSTVLVARGAFHSSGTRVAHCKGEGAGAGVGVTG